MNRLVCVVLTALALSAFGSGCCCMDRYYHGDCAGPASWGRNCGGGACRGGTCNDGCADGSCASGGCSDGSCGATADCGGCGKCDLCAFNPIKSLFKSIGCSSGCGEFYFDEWINDPPDACDPCDDCGNFVGQRCCPPRWFLGGRNTSCYTCAQNCDTSCGFDGGCSTPGCTSCGHGGALHDHSPHGEMIETVPTPQPEMMDEMPTTARRTSKPYYNNSGTRRVSHSQPQKQPTPAVRRTSHTTLTTASAPIGSGVRGR